MDHKIWAERERERFCMRIGRGDVEKRRKREKDGLEEVKSNEEKRPCKEGSGQAIRGEGSTMQWL